MTADRDQRIVMERGAGGQANKFGETEMPILFFILLVILIAMFGFWTTLGAFLGAVAMIVVFVLVAAAVVAVGLMAFARHLFR